MRGMCEEELAMEKGMKSNLFEIRKSFSLVKKWADGQLSKQQLVVWTGLYIP